MKINVTPRTNEDAQETSWRRSVGTAVNGKLDITDGKIDAGYLAAGGYAPMTVYSAGVERFRIGTNGDVTVSTAALLGYGTGSGGAVTQLTSKSTAVTLNKPTGAITTTADAMVANAVVFFTVNNSLVTVNDTVVLSLRSGDATGGSYSYAVTNVLAGGFNISIRNLTAASRSEALAFNFSVIKGVVS